MMKHVAWGWLWVILAWLAPDFAHASDQLVVLAYHDVQPQADRGKDPDAITPDRFISQLEWLRGHDWTFVSLDQVLAARAGGPVLPDRAVMLTIDDGLASAYTQIYPLLRAYRIPATLALVDSWINQAPGRSFDYNGTSCGSSCFVTWDQVREMDRSGWVTIISHSHDLHHGILANPQGNLEPAGMAAAHGSGGYESEAQYRARIRADLRESQTLLTRELSHPVRAIAWPYGAYNAIQVEEAKSLNMDSLGLSAVSATLVHAPVIERFLMGHDVELDDLASKIQAPAPVLGKRAIVVSFRDLWAPTVADQDARLGLLVQRVHDLGVDEVWLTDPWWPEGSDWVSAGPAPALTLRADLWNRVIWQLRTRSGANAVIVVPTAQVPGVSLSDLLGNLSRQAALTSVVLDGPVSLAEQQRGWTAVRRWRPAASLRLHAPLNAPRAASVHPVVDTLAEAAADPQAFFWVPTAPSDVAAVAQLQAAVAGGTNRLVYRPKDPLSSAVSWSPLRPGLSSSAFPYKRP